MATKGMTLVGLDVHARQTHAAVLAPATGELSVSKLGMPPPEVTPFLEGLGPAVQAVYEAGRPGSVWPGRRASAASTCAWLRRGRSRRGRATGSRPTAATPCAWCGSWPPASFGSRSCRASRTSASATWCERSRTCAATRCAPATGAGNSCSGAASATRARARPGRPGTWPAASVRGPLFAGDLRRPPGRGRAAHRPPRHADRRARAAGPRVEPRRRDRQAALLSRDRHALGRGPLRRGRRLRALRATQPPGGLSRHRALRVHLRREAPPRLDHQGPAPHARRLVVEAAHHYRHRPAISQTLARRQQGQDPRVIEIAWRAQRRLNQRWQHLRTARGKPAGVVAIACARGLAAFSGRQPSSMTDQPPTTAPRTLPGRTQAPRKAHDRRARLAKGLWAAGPRRPRPLLDREPRRTPGLEVKPSNISLTPQSTRLDLPPVPPRNAPRAPECQR
jgi:hypothetical protein